jgi:hypothetical protein
MRYSYILIIFFVLFTSCNLKSRNQEQCNLDSVDYKIYSILLDKYVIHEIDSTLEFVEKTEEIHPIKNPRRNLLLIDSTKTYNSNVNEPFLKSDSLLFESFKKQNSFKCKLDTSFYKSLNFHGISDFTFRNSLRKDIIKGYNDLYDKYKDVTGIVEFSKVGYNYRKTKALVEICLYRTPKNSFGLFVWLEFISGKWKIIGYKIDWVS